MAENATELTPDDPEFWGETFDRTVDLGGHEAVVELEPVAEPEDSLPEFTGDVGSLMATAEEAEGEIERGIRGARKIYKRYGDDVLKWSRGTNADPFFALAVMGVETGGHSHHIKGPKVSSAGAAGIGQFMPETWAEASKSVYGESRHPDERFEPKVAGPVVFYYLDFLQKNGFQSLPEMAAAYNAGPGTVLKFKKGKRDSLPLETRKYMTGVLATMHVIEREILGEVVPNVEDTPEEAESDTIELPQSDDDWLRESMRGG